MIITTNKKGHKHILRLAQACLAVCWLSTALFFGASLAESPEDEADLLEGESIEGLGDFSPEQDLEEAQGPVEEMKVTGSRIRRIDMETPNPITVWTKEDLENKGYFNVSDFFINSPLSNFGMLGVHSRNTLQLINGARINFDTIDKGGNGIKEVIDFLPISAIERVEILKGASSALYGSDVTGGVVNIITKKWMDRPEISFKIAPALYPFYKGGDQAEASFAFGKKFSRGNFISAWQFQYGRRLKVSERSKKWHEGGLIPYSPYPVFITGGSVIVDQKCPTASDNFVKTNKACLYNTRAFELYMPSSYDVSGYNYGEWRMNSHIKFYSQLFGFWSRSIYHGRDLNDTTGKGLGDLELPSGHQMSQGGGAKGVLQYWFKDALETRTGLFLDGTAGVKGWLSKTWDFDFSLKWSGMWDKTAYKNALLKENLIQAVASGAYDPFDPTRRDLSSIKRHTAFTRNHDSKIYSSLDFSGESVWDIDLALGLQAWRDRYTHIVDDKIQQGQVFAYRGTTASSGPMSKRTVVAHYLEGVKNFSDILELQAAYRTDYYFDFGFTFNPSVALLYKPSDNFLIRWSGGRGFEAPELHHVYSPLTSSDVYIGHPNPIVPYYDTVACYNELKGAGHFQPVAQALGEKSEDEKDKLIREFLIEQSSITKNKDVSPDVKQAFKGLTEQLTKTEHCNYYMVTGQSSGNKDINPAITYRSSLGFHWEPIEDHSLTVDGWWNWLGGVPSSFPFTIKKMYDAELRHGKKYVEENSILRYEREATAPHKVKNPKQKTVNLSQRQLYGIDAKWRSDFKNYRFNGGWFYFEDELAWVISSGVENFHGMGFISNLGKYTLPRWRNFASFGWKNNRHNISLILKSAAGVKKGNNEFETLPMNNIVDLFYQYKMDEKTALKAGWYNALFFGPVIDDSKQNELKINTDFYDVRGPRFFVELRRSL